MRESDFKFVRQKSHDDCVTACVAMALSYHYRQLSLNVDDLEEATRLAQFHLQLEIGRAGDGVPVTEIVRFLNRDFLPEVGLSAQRIVPVTIEDTVPTLVSRLHAGNPVLMIVESGAREYIPHSYVVSKHGITDYHAVLVIDYRQDALDAKFLVLDPDESLRTVVQDVSREFVAGPWLRSMRIAGLLSHSLWELMKRE